MPHFQVPCANRLAPRFILILCCLSILFVGGVAAQQYTLIQSDLGLTFKDSQDKIRYVIHIDSMNTSGGDTVFFPYRIVDPAYDWQTSCRNPRDTAWLGTQVVKHSSGSYTFFNAHNDSIHVHPMQPQGASWRMMDLPNGAYLEAAVSSVAAGNMLGLADSLKTVTVQAKTAGGGFLSHPANGFQFTLSQKFGWQDAPLLHLFPDSLTTYSVTGALKDQLGIYVPDKAAAFDQDIGDEYHYELRRFSYGGYDSSVWTRWMKRIILDKQVTANNIIYTDSIAWVEKYTEGPMYPLTAWTSHYGTATRVIALQPSDAFPPPMAHDSSKILFPPSTFAGDVSAGFSEAFADTVYGRRVTREFKFWGGGQSWISNDSCLRVEDPSYSDFSGYERWTDGLGMVNWNKRRDYINISGQLSDRGDLVYYQKGSAGLNWGTPVDLDSLLATNREKPAPGMLEVNIWPNPGQAGVWVEYAEGIEQVRLLSAQGGVVKVLDGKRRERVWLDRAGVAAGLYLVEVRSEEGGSGYFRVVFE